MVIHRNSTSKWGIHNEPTTTDETSRLLGSNNFPVENKDNKDDDVLSKSNKDDDNNNNNDTDNSNNDNNHSTTTIVHDMMDAVVEECQQLKEAFLEDITDEAVLTEPFFLPVAWTRGLSNLTDGDLQTNEMSDLEHLTTTTTTTTNTEESCQLRYPSLSAYLLLATAVISLSAIAPLLDLQNDVAPAMKLYWRQCATSMLLLPLAIHSICTEGFYQQQQKVDWVFLLATALCYAINCGTFVAALEYTSVGNAVIFGNAQAMILLIAKVVMGQSISLVQGLGASVACLGAIFCSKDSNNEAQVQGGSGEPVVSSLYGDFLALICGISGVFYLVFAKKVCHCMTLYVFMFFIMTFSSCFVLLFILITHQDVTFNRHITIGIFGWMNWAPHRLGLEMAMVIICNMLGSMGYIRAMQDFDNLAIAVASLMEPVIAEIMALMLGVGTLPGVMGWIGNLMVMSGTIAVVTPTSSRPSKLQACQ